MKQNSEHGWKRYNGLTCNQDGCDAKVLKQVPSGITECTEGHRTQHKICDDCEEEIMETHLGEFCGCDN